MSKKKTTTESTEITEVGFEGLIGFSEQTQTTMQTQAARSVDIALVVRNWLFGWYIVSLNLKKREHRKKVSMAKHLCLSSPND